VPQKSNILFWPKHQNFTLATGFYATKTFCVCRLAIAGLFQRIDVFSSIILRLQLKKLPLGNVCMPLHSFREETPA